MRILVTFAVEAEFAPWRALRQFEKSTNGKCAGPSFQATLAGKEIHVLLTGMGKAACEKSLAWNMHAGKPDIVISSGLVGALKEDLKPGDVIVPERTRTLRNDASANSDSMLRERAVQQGALAIETLITVDRIVQTAEEKARLAFFGQAVDMESAIIMSHFAVSGVPALAVRAVSDAAKEDLPIDFDRCLTPLGAIKLMSLVNAIVKRPGKLPNLIRFGKQSAEAAQKLAQFLDDFVAAQNIIQTRIEAV